MCKENKQSGIEACEAAAEQLASADIADMREVLETLTRILRREETEDAVQKVRTETRSDDGYGDITVQKDEKTETVQLRPRLADVNRAAELLGRYYGMFRDRVEGSIALPVIICGEDELQ